MRRADSGQSAGRDFAAFGHEAGEQAHVFVVDGIDFLGAEFADFLAAEKLASARSALTAARAALYCLFLSGCSDNSVAGIN